MEAHITKHRRGFPVGCTLITREGEEGSDTGIDFSILKLNTGEVFREKTEKETAYLHMDGEVSVLLGDQVYKNTRNSLFDDSPFSVHVARESTIVFTAKSDVEIAIMRTSNNEKFPVEVYSPSKVENENRGAGQVDGACLRWVRTIFDDTISHSNSKLVLGEVVNMPGKWSSYPPHHHPQPEIYHYRFTDEKGYGHAELGENVVKVRPNDTVKILDNNDHAQCSAPGYGMYYIWVIRHLENLRYTVPEFTEDHSWTREENANIWKPQVEVSV
jgi:5-deoxy-glucuronate isomerase